METPSSQPANSLDLKNILVEKEEKNALTNSLKSQIVSLVSHEFRTPLTIVLSSVEILKRHRDSLSEEKKQKHLERIELSAKRLAELVSEALGGIDC